VYGLDVSLWRPRPARVEHVPAGQQVDPAAVAEPEREQVVSVLRGVRYLGRADQGRRVDLGREVPGVGQDDTVAQQREIGGGQHVPGAGDGDDDVRVGDGGIARRRAEPVQV